MKQRLTGIFPGGRAIVGLSAARRRGHGFTGRSNALFGADDGAGFMLAFLMASLSGQITAWSGVSYSSSESFLLCCIFNVALLVAAPLARRPLVRVGLSVASLLLLAVWTTALFVLSAVGYQLSEGAASVFGFLGRAFGILLAVQWNLHFSLQRLGEAVPSVIGSVIVATMLYILGCLLGGLAALALYCVLFAASCLLSLYVERTGTSNPTSEQFVDAVSAADAAAPFDVRSRRRTRVLFFSSRIVYSLCAGFVIGLAAMVTVPQLVALPIVAIVLVNLGAAFVAAWVARGIPKVALFQLAVLPLAVISALVLCFYSDSASRLAPVMAMAIELVWTIQLYAQLPSYRQMTGMNPVVFAYREKLVSLLCFSVSAWAVSLIGGDILVADGEGTVAWFINGSFVLLAVWAVLALGRHIVRYYPIALEEGSAAAVEAEGKDDIRASLAARFGLTPKESEVLFYLSKGFSQPYIGKMLYISKGTVKVHAYHIYQKMGVSSQDELIEMTDGCEGGK